MGRSWCGAALTIFSAGAAQRVEVPVHCYSWFDGCNTCATRDRQISACTSLVCAQPGVAECLACDHGFGLSQGQCRSLVPDHCTAWHDGCNMCAVETGQVKVCSHEACTFLKKPQCYACEAGFELSQGECKKLTHCAMWYNGCQTCAVENGRAVLCTMHSCPNQQRAQCRACEAGFELSEGQCKIPSRCASWYDGCNTCQVKNSKASKCTSKTCTQHRGPACLACQPGFELSNGQCTLPSNCALWYDGCSTCLVKSFPSGCTPSCSNPGAAQCRACKPGFQLSIAEGSCAESGTHLRRSAPRSSNSSDRAEAEVVDTADTDGSPGLRLCWRVQVVAIVITLLGKSD